MTTNNEESVDLTSPEVQNLIKLTNEVVKANKTFQIDTLYQLAKEKLNFSSEKFVKTFNTLFNNETYIESAELEKNDVLANPIRAKIFRLINEQPGAHFSNIIKLMVEENEKVSLGQFFWHLEILTKYNFIKKIEFRNFTLYFNTNIDDFMGICFFLIRERINRKIVDYLIKEESVFLDQLPNKIYESKEKLNSRLKILNEEKIIVVQRNEGTEAIQLLLNPDKKSVFIEVLKKLPPIQ